MLLSVIIPVYNVEKYVEKCILSVINNNLKSEDYEIFVVEDESPDGSVAIVNKLMARYPQIKLFSQKNKGLGGARNTGILNASGKYVLFLDADDYLKENTLKNIITFAIENKLDILEFGAIGVSEKGDEVYKNSKSTDIVISGFEYLDNTNYMNSACNKLYAVSFLNKYALKFKERIFIEDFEFNTRAFYYATKVQVIANILGCFVQTANSITRNVDGQKNLKMVEDIQEVIDLTLKFEKEESNFRPNINKIFKKRIAFLTVTLLYNLMKLSIVKKQRKLIIEGLKRKKLYPIKTPIRNKNLFRIVSNN
jgi:glycosyltransferase involved in cell wall biosynthesis